MGLEQQKLEAQRQNLLTQIEANKEAQRRAIAAQDRQQLQRLKADAENLAASLRQRDRERRSLEDQARMRDATQREQIRQTTETTRRGQYAQLISNAQQAYTAEVNTIRLSQDLSEEGKTAALQAARRRLDAAIRFGRTTYPEISRNSRWDYAE